MKGVILSCVLFVFSFTLVASELRFAMVPKQTDNPFFIASGEGCKAAAEELGNVQCIFRGSKNIDVRSQDKIISELIDEGVDGIAVAVSQSKYLASHSIKKALDRGIPVIAYDADFDRKTLEEHPNLRLAYVGTNNFEIGESLGNLLKQQRPNGGALVIQSGRPDSPNLNLRVMGVRSALSGKTYDSPPGIRLEGENGWKELSNPLYNYCQFDRAMKELKTVIITYRAKKLDAFVAVGGWTQFVDGYRELIKPHKDALEMKDLILIIADSADIQLEYLKDKLAHGNVGQNPFEMGKQAILTLYKIVNKQDYKKVTYIPLNICTQKNYSTCTNN
jgi:ribose transport system substrate-binding protein